VKKRRFLQSLLLNELTGHIFLLVAQVIYALNYSMVKDAMPVYIGPSALVFLRIAGAFVLFQVLEIIMVRKKIPVSRSIMKELFLLSLAGVVINQIFFIGGLKYTTPINSAIIMVSSPIMVFLFSSFMKKNFLRWTGLALSSLGAIILLSFKGDFRIGSDTWLGDFMTLINAASWALFIVKSRSFFVEYHPVWMMKWLFFFGLIVYAPFGIPALMEVNFSAFTAHAWFAVFFVVVMTTFVAYLLNLYGLKIHSPETVSAYIYLQPLLAGTLAIFLGKDELTPTKLLSGILIILGLYLINRKNSS